MTDPARYPAAIPLVFVVASHQTGACQLLAPPTQPPVPANTMATPAPPWARRWCLQQRAPRPCAQHSVLVRIAGPLCQRSAAAAAFTVAPDDKAKCRRCSGDADDGDGGGNGCSEQEATRSLSAHHQVATRWQPVAGHPPPRTFLIERFLYRRGSGRVVTTQASVAHRGGGCYDTASHSCRCGWPPVIAVTDADAAAETHRPRPVASSYDVHRSPFVPLRSWGDAAKTPWPHPHH